MLGFGETARLTSVVPSGGIDVLERERQEREIERARIGEWGASFQGRKGIDLLKGKRI